MLWDDMLFSTINEHPPAVWKLFTVCLLRCDSEGCFRGTVESMARLANMELEETRSALEVLTGPDEHSTSPDHGGRRLVPEGPNRWRVVNYEYYRKKQARESQRMKWAEDKRRQRGTLVDSGGHGVDKVGQEVDPVPVSVYVDVDDNTPKKKKKRSVFKPPSVDEVRGYLEERGETRIDPQAFVDFYESKGWMVGKNKMKSWKAAVGTWITRRNEDGAKQRVGVSRPTAEGGWLYDTVRESDRNKFGNHSRWEEYSDAAGDFPPRKAPPFEEWLKGAG